MQHHFHYHIEKEDHCAILLTIFVNNSLQSPAKEIQEDVIQRAHQISEWFEFEIVTEGERTDFESIIICKRKDCKRNFVVEAKTNFYVIFTENDENFEDIIDILESMKSYNPFAFCLIYLQTNRPNSKILADNILSVMWKHLMAYAAVLVPKNQTVLNLYQTNLVTQGPNACGSNRTIFRIDQCVNG